MKTEKIVISFIAVLMGILVAGIIFYFYQKTKVIPQSQTKVVTLLSPTASPHTSILLTVDRPLDETVVDTKTLTISGKTTADAIVVVTTDTSDQVLSPAQNGNFSTTVILANGANRIVVTAIAPNGEEAKIIRTVTFSTESF